MASLPVGGTYYNGAQIATPSNPSSGYDNLFFKSDDNAYWQTSGGTVSQFGTVTSLGITAPAWLTVSNSPITKSGNIALTANLGNLTDVGTDGITITGGTASIPVSVSFAQAASSASQNGYLSSGNFTGFNSISANGIKSLTGDGTATGPGAAALTLATVNSNIGTFGSTSFVPGFVVNAKGLITSVSNNLIVAPAGTLTGTTLNSTVISSSLVSVGTITQGTWDGTAIGAEWGGTGKNFSASTGAISVSAGTFSAGTLPVTDGGTGIVTATAYNPIIGGTTATGAFQTVTGAGLSGQILVNQGNGTAPPVWGPMPTNAYFSGYMNPASQWGWSGSTWAASTTAGLNSLTQIGLATMSVTVAASQLPGITFTPASASAIYHVTATFSVENSSVNDQCAFSLWDGANRFGYSGLFQEANASGPSFGLATISSIYAPGTASAVTVQIEAASFSGNCLINGGGTAAGNNLAPTITWTIFQIK